MPSPFSGNTPSDSNTITVQERYIDGFRTGARFMLDILTGESENLAPLVQTES